MHHFRLILMLSLTALLAVGGSSPLAANEQAARIEFFEKQVRPIFARHCVACHAAETKPSGGLRVDDRQGLLTGGNSGPAIVPGNPTASTLLKRVTQQGKGHMPAEGEPLTEEQVAVLTRWIEEGAAWPATELRLERESADYEQLRRTHWSWQPLAAVSVPLVRQTDWPRDDIDRFLLARLEASDLTPVADADRATRLRRVTYDLTGLPPTPEELADFLADDSSTAWERVVDRLLRTPAFGEHWGRHWLDVARYGESTGPSRNIPYPHAWRYRDYVIDALQRDVPFDQFIREQVAGDLLPAENDEQRNRQLIATGFLALGVKDVNQRFPIRFQLDNVDEQIDVVSRAVLGLTASCARCHDHKFDPIPQRDYYALAGIFTSTEMHAGVRSQMGGSGLAYYVPKRLVVLAGDLAPADPAETERLTVATREAKELWDKVRGTPEGLKPGPNGVPYQRTLRQKYEALQAQLQQLTDPAARGLVAHGVRDSEKIGDTELRVRGEAEKLGPVVPRGFLSVVPASSSPSLPTDRSGRRELAEWLTQADNPLTPRVFVNRVWAHLFGRGLVGTVDNFGVTGDAPSHPELLDYLARSTVSDGWSLQRLVRRLVLTRAYQLSADSTPVHLAQDPGNRLVWRHAPRRLTTEEIRDSLLAFAGTLDRQRPARSASRQLRMVEIQDNGREAKTLHEEANKSVARSVYLPQLRGVTPQSLAAFDPVEQTLVSGSRDVTTVPGQALFLLNSSFVRQRALEFARRLLAQDTAEEERIRAALPIVLGRAATDADVSRALAFLNEYSATYRGEASADPVVAAADPSADSTTPPPPENPDEADQSGVAIRETQVRPSSSREAAWLAYAQALFATAEMRYVR